MTSMQRKGLFACLWLSFSAYAFCLAPPNDPQTLDQIVALSTGQWGSLNPAIVALFNLMGVWPLIYAAVLLQDGHCQVPETIPEVDSNSAAGGENSVLEERTKRTPAWPFVLGSFGLGAFALLPYLGLRSPAPVWQGEPSKLIRILDSRWFGIFLLLNALGWLLYGLAQGDWANFWEQWHSSRFIHVMSLDFCALTLLFPTLAWDDTQRHSGLKPAWVWATPMLPIVGAALYLCSRSELQSPETGRSA